MKRTIFDDNVDVEEIEVQRLLPGRTAHERRVWRHDPNYQHSWKPIPTSEAERLARVHADKIRQSVIKLCEKTMSNAVATPATTDSLPSKRQIRRYVGDTGSGNHLLAKHEIDDIII